MFRESDERDRHLHNSYRTKPTSIIQAAAQHSRLDESARQQNITNQDVLHARVPEAVPSTYDVVYDPSHPDADWSGMVSLKNQHKKHSTNHSSQRMGIEQNEHGIVAKVERQEWGHRRQPEGASKNNSQLVIGGINTEEDRFKTEYRRFATNEGTSRDQLTLEKRQKAVRQINDPAQARSMRDRQQGEQGGYSGNSPRYGDSDYAPSPGGYQNNTPFNGTNSAGQYQQQYGGGDYGGQSSAAFSKKSFLDGIADSIATKVAAPPKVSNTDSAFSKNRVLVTDNYQVFPGYTGGRK